jgi:4-hydroxyphenylpyruvate dioxygenase
MIPALAQVCSLPAPFPQDVSDYAAGRCQAVELWLTKLETYTSKHSAAEARRILADLGLAPAAAGFQGGLLDSQGAARKEAWDLFRGRLDLCAELGVATIVVACDVAELLSRETIERVRVSLTQVAQQCEQRKVRAALEFQARSALGNNLQTAAALVSQAASPWLGLCLDAFHFYVGPSKLEDLQLITRENLFHVQFCDLADIPRELASDSDRILPGDGDIPLAPIVQRLREIDYAGYVSLELYNPRLWQTPARQFGEIGLTALRAALGQASMGA